MSHTTEFWRLLHEAHDSQEMVDNFDLDSADARQRATFDVLRRQEDAAAVMLISFVALRWNELMLAFTDPDRGRSPASPPPAESVSAPKEAETCPQSMQDVMNEWFRRRGDGFTQGFDDQWMSGELAKAGAIYADGASRDDYEMALRNRMPNGAPFGWPFSPDMWKPEGRRADLVKAAALIVAEIERLDRVQAREDAEILRNDQQRVAVGEPSKLGQNASAADTGEQDRSAGDRDDG